MIKGLRARLGLVPLLLAALVLAATALTYAVATFSGTSFSGSNRPGSVVEYRWTGGTILVQRGKGNRGCSVRPDNGPEVDISVRSQKTARYDAVTELQPWFSGAATVKCQGSFKVWTGAMAGLKKFTSSFGFFAGAAALTVLPLLAGILRRGRRRT
ncbi:hypothetical protein [Actinokineospora sp.]|uniref:hypothetical protein n=1 Tax=Actinokineospora sp. TaxID=1872133 RepID=UPI0040384391